MFIENKYYKWYHSIINSAKNEKTIDYTEKHHIIPKSLGGNNSKQNLVILTARQHYICHWLLTKFVEKQFRFKMYSAFNRMNFKNKTGVVDNFYFNSRAYEFNKIQFSKYMSEFQKHYKKTKEHIEKIASKLRGRPLSEEARLNISKAKIGQKLSISHKANIAKGLKKTYVLLSPYNKTITVDDITIFCKDNDISVKSLQRTEKTKKPISQHKLLLQPNSIGWSVISSFKN